MEVQQGYRGGNRTKDKGGRSFRLGLFPGHYWLHYYPGGSPASLKPLLALTLRVTDVTLGLFLLCLVILE